MHDEASSHYVSMIDQTSLGHKFLKEEFGYTPTVGWQIDPFGHSNTHAWLSSAVGFDSLFFGRIDYQDHDKRMTEKRMEMIWKVTTSSFTSRLTDKMTTRYMHFRAQNLTRIRRYSQASSQAATTAPLLAFASTLHATIAEMIPWLTTSTWKHAMRMIKFKRSSPPS